MEKKIEPALDRETESNYAWEVHQSIWQLCRYDSEKEIAVATNWPFRSSVVSCGCLKNEQLVSTMKSKYPFAWRTASREVFHGSKGISADKANIKKSSEFCSQKASGDPAAVRASQTGLSQAGDLSGNGERLSSTGRGRNGSGSSYTAKDSSISDRRMPWFEGSVTSWM